MTLQVMFETPRITPHFLALASEKDDWETPPDFFKALDDEFHFTLDACANAVNHKCERYFSKKDNALLQPWAPERVFMNPPYGRQIATWVKKAYRESRRGALVVCLLPSRTDTAWFHDYVVRGEVRFVRGRLKFVGIDNPAPFAQLVVIFRPHTLDISHEVTP